MLLLAALPFLWWDDAGAVPVLREKVAQVAAVPANCTALQPPAVNYRTNVASATTSPWLDARGWRIARTPQQPFCYDAVPTEKLAVTAAEAFAFGGEAVYIRPASPDGLPVLATTLEFLQGVARPAEPPLANIAVVDDGSEMVGEVQNLLARRNLMYKPVSQPASGFDLVVRIDQAAHIGRKKFPRDHAKDPSGFVQQVRYELTDDRRLLRLYGSEVVLGRLTGEGRHVRLHLINYGPRPVEGLRVRVLGPLTVERSAGLGQPDFHLEDIAPEAKALEFTVAKLATYAVIDLTRTIH